MKKNTNLQDKAMGFVIKIRNLYKYLNNKSEFIISRQILRSGTRIGANIWEAEFSESTKDLVHKFSISLKEVHETIYWLQFLKNTSEISNEYFLELFFEAEELLKILITIIKKLKYKP
jgi:four helix bundle protein